MQWRLVLESLYATKNKPVEITIKLYTMFLCLREIDLIRCKSCTSNNKYDKIGICQINTTVFVSIKKRFIFENHNFTNQF